MKLSFRSEYALLALAYLAHSGQGKFLSSKNIAQEQGIPAKYLEQVLVTLKREGYIRCFKGQEEGFALAKLPNQITLAEIIRLFDGALSPTGSASIFFYESTPIEQNANLLRVFKDIRNYIAEKLENTTLADI